MLYKVGRLALDLERQMFTSAVYSRRRIKTKDQEEYTGSSEARISEK